MVAPTMEAVSRLQHLEEGCPDLVRAMPERFGGGDHRTRAGSQKTTSCRSQ
jgi:hypothetical protein